MLSLLWAWQLNLRTYAHVVTFDSSHYRDNDYPWDVGRPRLHVLVQNTYSIILSTTYDWKAKEVASSGGAQYCRPGRNSYWTTTEAAGLYSSDPRRTLPPDITEVLMYILNSPKVKMSTVDVWPEIKWNHWQSNLQFEMHPHWWFQSGQSDLPFQLWFHCKLQFLAEEACSGHQHFPNLF